MRCRTRRRLFVSLAIAAGLGIVAAGNVHLVWASLQSQPLDRRETLETRVHDFDKRFEGREVPRPPYWSGFHLQPERVEFWHGRAYRLHDRTLYQWQDGHWVSGKLYP